MEDWKKQLSGIRDLICKKETRPAWLCDYHSQHAVPIERAYYYRFLYEVTRALKPQFTVEIGTNTAVSTASLAAGHPSGQILTIDPNPDVIRYVNAIRDKGIVNVSLISEPSLKAHVQLAKYPKINLNRLITA